LFPFFGKSEKAYLRQYQSEIDTYLEEFPDSSYNDMKERIGSPKDVIFSYYDNIENDDLMNKIRISKYFKRVLLIILGIFILYFSIQFACLYKSYHDLQDSIIIHENTTIQEIK
jgi:hypothetical protein